MSWEDFEKELEEERRKEEEERLQSLKDCHEKFYRLNDGSFTYDCLVLMVCKRYNLNIDDIPNAAYGVVNYYLDNDIETSFHDYIYCDTAPMVKPVKKLREIFPEFNFAEKPKQVVELANKIYGLDLEIVKDGMYGGAHIFSPSFDFNSFTPIPVDKIHELKEEIKILEKYGSSTDKIKKELDEFELPEDVLELI